MLLKLPDRVFKPLHLNTVGEFMTLLCAFFDSLMKDYFYKPPINKLSLTFLEKSLESAYRISYQEEVSLHLRYKIDVHPDNMITSVCVLLFILRV